MHHDNMYISLGISPDATAIVMQPVIAGGSCPHFPFTASIAELNSRGKTEAINKIGGSVLTAMRAFFPLINIFADELIQCRQFERLTVDPGDRSGNIRASHLRVHFNNDDRNLVIRRFNDNHEANHANPALLLKIVTEPEPQAATDLAGTILLTELVAMHPEVFASFPALRRD